ESVADEAPELPNVEFEAPSGSGLEGVTDVALVMANAMSRIVEERPELRGELDAMQQQQSQPPSSERVPASRRLGRGDSHDERSARKRRRRRRRGRRVDWTDSEGALGEADPTSKLLDEVAATLADAAPRSLHVRQIAEALAQKG